MVARSEASVKNFIRLFATVFAGSICLFVLQPPLFLSGAIELISVEPEEWVDFEYKTGAQIVFVTSLLSTLVWYGVASYFNHLDKRPSMMVFKGIWWGLFLLAGSSILLAVVVFNESNEALLWLVFLYTLDAVLLFWLATAVSTPVSFKTGVIPGSGIIRRLPGFR